MIKCLSLKKYPKFKSITEYEDMHTESARRLAELRAVHEHNCKVVKRADQISIFVLVVVLLSSFAIVQLS